NAFKDASSLNNITFSPSSNLEWLGGIGTFTGTGISILQLPVSTKIIDGKMEGTFSNAKITAFDIPSNVTEIGSRTFANTDIASIIIPEGVTAIGNNAFSGATHLETLELPEKVMKIGERAFYGMTGLKELIINNPDPDIF